MLISFFRRIVIYGVLSSVFLVGGFFMNVPLAQADQMTATVITQQTSPSNIGDHCHERGTCHCVSPGHCHIHERNRDRDRSGR